jgi:hypothetical protein
MEHKRFWIGRLCAEAHTATAVRFVTLTYGGGYDDPTAYTLRYGHIQKLFKRWRKAGHQFRYAIVGEYGSEKGRAHWHALLFFTGRTMPEHELNERIHVEGWDYGHTYWEVPRSKSGTCAYIFKYLDKPGTAKERMRFSTGLGSEWLMEYARERARAGVQLWPEGPPTFTVPGITRTKLKAEERAAYRGSMPLFWYVIPPDSKLVELMCRAYFETWGHCRPKKMIRIQNRIVEDQLDQLNNHWRDITYGERQFLRLHGYEEPQFRCVIEPESWVTVPEYPGVMLLTCRVSAVQQYEYIDEEGQRLWQAVRDEDREGGADPRELAQLLPEKLLDLIEARRRREQLHREHVETGHWLGPKALSPEFNSDKSVTGRALMSYRSRSSRAECHSPPPPGGDRWKRNDSARTGPKHASRVPKPTSARAPHRAGPGATSRGADP